MLRLQPHTVAEQLGHKDGGELVIDLYGHPDQAQARNDIREAFEKHATVTELRLVRGGSA